MMTVSPQSSLHTLDDYLPQQQALQYLHIDDDLLIVAKPAGLLSVPGRAEGMQDCLVHRVQADYPDALVVHRLDMATSGLMVLARGALRQRELSLAFAERQVDKRYIALLDGVLQPDSGEVALPLMADWLQRPKQKADPAGKPALTQFTVLARDESRGQTRVALMPVTGRTHQLRVHMLALGHPIIGDALYDAPPAPRLMLHAEYLALPHPDHGGWLQWQLAADF